jgi:3-oxoadipate enol-lactonase
MVFDLNLTRQMRQMHRNSNMPELMINGERFNIRIDGADSAPALLLSNSLSTNLSMWDGQIADWATRFRVIRYDSRGHGASAAPDRPYSIAELGRDALAVLDALKIQRAHFCGLSKGGMVGMWLATHAADRLNKVVLANTAARMAPPNLWNARIQTVKAGGMEAIVDGTLQRWFSPAWLAIKPTSLGDVRKMILATPALGYAGCCAAIRDMDQREAIRQITNPVLVISGAQDPATPPAAAKQIHESIRGSKLVSLDAAHLSNLEKPAEFTKAVADFLK